MIWTPSGASATKLPELWPSSPHSTQKEGRGCRRVGFLARMGQEKLGTGTKFIKHQICDWDFTNTCYPLNIQFPLEPWERDLMMDWGSEPLYDLFTITCLVSKRARIQAQFYLTPWTGLYICTVFMKGVQFNPVNSIDPSIGLPWVHTHNLFNTHTQNSLVLKVKNESRCILDNIFYINGIVVCYLLFCIQLTMYQDHFSHQFIKHPLFISHLYLISQYVP